MNKLAANTAEFERKKNMNALLYTAVVTGLILLMFFLMSLTVPPKEQFVADEYIEINLGTGDLGSGTDQPLLPGEPAPSQQADYIPPQPVRSVDESVRDISTNETSPDAATVVKPAVSREDASRVNQESRTTSRNTSTPQPAVTNPDPKPRAVLGRMTGGNGPGGNGADTYKPGGNEGIAGGEGDQGRVGGDPNGRSYTGTPRNLGARIVNIPSRSFEDDFKESGTVVLDIVVNSSGKLVSATYQPAGSSITNRNQIEIARKRAAEMDYPKYEGGFKQRITMKFKVES